MTLVDTSVWVDHLRRGNQRLRRLLEEQLVLVHPFVVGELALGRIRRRSEILGLLADLPQVAVATHQEAMEFVERHDLEGAGVGWVDLHLLVSAALSRAGVWTLDRRLSAAAQRLSLAG